MSDKYVRTNKLTFGFLSTGNQVDGKSLYLAELKKQMKKVSILQQVRKESWHITICVRQFANNNIRLLLHPEPIQYDT